MRRLAANDKAALYKIGGEYWIVAYDDNVGPCKFSERALNDASDNYNSRHALAYFERYFGKPSWTHERIFHY